MTLVGLEGEIFLVNFMVFDNKTLGEGAVCVYTDIYLFIFLLFSGVLPLLPPRLGYVTHHTLLPCSYDQTERS